MRKPGTVAARSAHKAPGSSCLFEMQEFAGFPKSAQRYIRRSLDIGLARSDAVQRWSRSPAERASIEAQQGAYRTLDQIRTSVADDSDPAMVGMLLAQLVPPIAFDLGEGRIACFASCRFLYERLIGARIRPWLPAAFCAASALPSIHPDRRAVLLQTLPEAAIAAAGWSIREPLFFPEWVDKVDAAAAA